MEKEFNKIDRETLKNLSKELDLEHSKKKEFNLSEKRKSYYTQLILDLRRVFQKWEYPLKFKIELEEEINIFREVMRDLDKEFIRLLKEELCHCIKEKGAEYYCSYCEFVNKLAGKELVEEKE